MGWHKRKYTTTHNERSQCLKSILNQQQLSNFSIKAESLSTFPLNTYQCLFGASHFFLVPDHGQVVMLTWLVKQHWWGWTHWRLSPVMLPSVCSKQGGPSSPLLGDDSLTDSAGNSALDFLWAPSFDLNFS